MGLLSLDVAMVVAYIIVIFVIALQANISLQRRSQIADTAENGAIERHYLAGKSITFLEALLSIIATEFSALAFLMIPTYVYFDNLSYLRFVIGACLSRMIVSIWFLPRIYGKGLTIFEVLARGVHGYPALTPEARRGKRTFAGFYLFSKIIGTSVKLLGGSVLIAELFSIPLFFALLLIALMTYLYIMLGGLKAVVRTDMIQAMVFILGGLVAHYAIGKISPNSWGELFSLGWQSGKFRLFDGWSGFVSFLTGIIAGICYDAATHGVDQDLSQKLIGARDLETARKALAWSAVGSLFVNMIFLALGVILWAFYLRQGLKIPPPDRLFSALINDYFPTPLKGLMVASLLAACMSTLDSAINALSTVFWNDFMSVDRSRLFRIFINIDNFIITVSIVVVAYLFSLIPGALAVGLHFAYLATAPLLVYFACQLLLFRHLKIGLSALQVTLTVLSCFLGFGIGHFRLSLPPHLTLLGGLVTSLFFTLVYTWIAAFTASTKEHIQ